VAKSRVSLKDRKAKDLRGVDALIKSTGSEKPAGKAGTSKQALTSGATVKTTVYIRPDQVIAIERIQLAEFERTGGKPDKYALAQEAFDLLIQKYGAKV